jgi:hypothetical protein
MRLPAVVIAVGLVCCPAFPAIAQEGTPSAVIQPEGGAEVRHGHARQHHDHLSGGRYPRP